MTKDEDFKQHPDFAGPEDTVLHSGDGVAFHIASSQLSSASGWFHTLFTVPQSQGTSRVSGPVELTLDEDALTLEILLKLCRGLPTGLARLTDLPDLERVLQAAEKYEMRGAVELLLLLLHTPRMQEDALHLYGLANRYEQKDVAESAFRRLLSMRIDYASCARIDTIPLLRLMAARQHRIEQFCTLLTRKDDTGPFSSENKGVCSYCRPQGRSTAFPNSMFSQWMVLVAALQRAYVMRPAVDALDEDEQVKLQITALETSICAYSQCRRLLFDWMNIRLRLQKMIDSL